MAVVSLLDLCGVEWLFSNSTRGPWLFCKVLGVQPGEPANRHETKQKKLYLEIRHVLAVYTNMKVHKQISGQLL